MSHRVERRQFQVPLAGDVAILEPEGPVGQILLLLHGYMQSGPAMLERLREVLPRDARVLAPNAPFLVPKTTETGVEATYSWYFYDFRTDEYVVDTQTALAQLEQLCGTTPAVPLTIVGFSQGGYLAPFVAPRVGARRVVGIGSRYLEDELPARLEFETWGIHGDADERVLPDPSQQSFLKIRPRSSGGNFFRLPGVGHHLGREVRRKLQEILQSPP